MTHWNLHSQLPLPDLFRSGYLPGVPWAQGFLVVQVHLACPEIKTDSYSIIVWPHYTIIFLKKCLVAGVQAFHTLWIIDKGNISIYLQVLLFHPVCHLFPFFQADPADQWNWSFSIFSCKDLDLQSHLSHVVTEYIFMMLYIKSFFLQSIQEDQAVPGFLWDPLCPSDNKQTNTNRSPSPKEKKWLMATITTRAGWPTC